eukprot:XP_015578382.1 uncharacterized protein LOC8264176 [Ricinus communis]
MPVSGKQETAVKSLGGQSGLNIAGVPVKKRRFIWPASPTPEEQQQSLLQNSENNSLEKQEHGSPSPESELAAGSSCLSDANKNIYQEENKRNSDNIVSSNSNHELRFRVEEPSQSQESDSLAKLDDDEKLSTAEKSANILTGVKPLGGVPMKKRRFFRPSSPPPEDQSSLHVGKSSLQKAHGNLSKESALSDAGVAVGSVLSEDDKISLPEDDKRSSDNTVQSNAVDYSRVKIEEARHITQSNAKVEKLMAVEKSVNIMVKSTETELNVAPNKSPSVHVSRKILNQQVEGRCKQISSVSGNPELSLGLKEPQLSAFEDQCNDASSWNQGNVEPVSLNLSLSNSERNSQLELDDVQSNTDSSKIFADRSNWDLNTTMDTWEASVGEEAAGQVTAGGSKKVGVTHDIKPLMSTGMVGASIASEKQLFKESESRTSFARASSQSVETSNSEDRLHLRLSPSFLSFNSQTSSSSSANLDSTSAVPNISLSRGLLSGGKTVNPRIVKSEPFDESHRPDSIGAKANSMVPLDFRAVSVKSELLEKVAQEAPSAGKSRDAKSMKSEPFHEGNPEKLKNMYGTSHQSNKQVLLGHDSRGLSTCSTNEHVIQGQDTGVQPTFSTGEQVVQGHNTIKNPTSSIGSSLNGNLSDYSGHRGDEGVHLSNEAPEESCESAEQVAAEMGSLPACQSCDENKCSGTVDAAVSEKKSVDNSDQCKLKFKDAVPPDAHRNGDGTVSDDEKINLSGDMLEEDSYGSEYESDGNSVPMDIEEDGRGQDDYEDGEVREPQLNAKVEGSICEKREDISQGDSDDTKVNSTELRADFHSSSSHAEGKDTNVEEPVETVKAALKDIDAIHDRNTTDADKDVSREESSAVDIVVSRADKRKLVKTIRRKPLDLATNKDKALGTEQSTNQAACATQGTILAATQGTILAATQGTDENVKTNGGEKNESALPKMETLINGDNAPKDANSGGNQSRIINLSIASNMSSFGKTRSISSKPLSLRSGRERLDVPLEGDRLHPRGRDEAYNDGSQKFTRERYQESRNSRWNFIHGRGRLASRIDSLRNDRDSERDCIPRHKYATAVAGSDTEFVNYNMGSDGVFAGGVRGGRKLVDDDTPIFRHFSSRRRSPGRRDGPASRGLQMVRRVPRSIDEDNSEVVGLRHTEKIMRGFPDDGEEHSYSHTQPPYEGLDGPFVQGTRSFSVQRRGLPQMHSKSPIRSRSPGPWSSRRRSPDGFVGPPELPHRRSPLYRMERMRSPDNPGFPADRVGRRHSSPSYLSRPNDLREMDPSRDHGHPRSIISNRSPTGRGGLLRGSRRFGIGDPRERPENEEFFAGPVHSGRFHELGGDGNEERRRFGERRAPVRSFRPPFNGTDGENFNFNTEDGPRSFRFYPEVDPDFHERPNLREREFDRRIKNRPGNAPRRPRSIEEQEGNYRHGGQVLYDDSFDDMSRVKRKRF